MSLELTAPPAAEPVSLAQAKAQLRLDTDADDALLGNLIATATRQIERAFGLALVTQGWTLRIDQWPARGGLVLPRSPVRSVDAVRVTTATGAITELAPGALILDGLAAAARVIPASAALPAPGVPAQGIEIAFTAGFGAAAAVPAPLRHAVLILTSHWYERREPADLDAGAAALPLAVRLLAGPYAAVRL